MGGGELNNKAPTWPAWRPFLIYIGNMAISVGSRASQALNLRRVLGIWSERRKTCAQDNSQKYLWPPNKQDRDPSHLRDEEMGVESRGGPSGHSDSKATKCVLSVTPVVGAGMRGIPSLT